jgi:lysophospholipase L1-like esterase
MKHLLGSVALAFLGLLLPFSPAIAQAPPIRIMPLGDSITFGSGAAGGYRNKLYQTLTAGGYNVDFVGTQTGNGVAALPDSDHQGISGWRIDQLDSNIAGWLGSIADPDVVLLHIGTNDFGQGVDTVNAINRLDALILKIAMLRPYAHIIVTNLMERGEPFNSQIVAQFNPYVQARVNAHATAGRRVTFLDMRSFVPLAEMPDQLHPGQAGYDHMADAWAPAIQAVIGQNGDNALPAIYRASRTADLTHINVTFSKPVADAAAGIANFSLSGGIPISAASLDASKRVVTLTTGLLALGTSYTLTVNNVQDRITPAPHTIAPGSSVNIAPITLRGYLNNVPESAGYTLACTLDVPNLVSYAAVQPAYTLDNRKLIGQFSRIAYYVELQQPGGGLQYLWASMDAFTADPMKIGVPTVATGALFQQGVTNMNVASNVDGVVVGNGLAGNIEFWPTNYAAPNGAGVPGASDSLYDFGDTQNPGNYGCMQLHNAAAAQTLFAFNNWGGRANPGNVDIGIGNQGTGNPDYTFSANGGNYIIKSIQVLVQTTGDIVGPAVTEASANFGGQSVRVTFSEPIAPASIVATNFALSNGVSVLSASLAANQRDITLQTTQQPPATALTLSASGVRDTSQNGNRMTPVTNFPVAAAALPPEIVANVGAAANSYQLVYSMDVPVVGNLIASGAAAYSTDNRAAIDPFGRVAYYLELQKSDSTTQFVWVSMDAFTGVRGKIGVPTPATGAIFQQNVSNMDVVSNVAGIATGSVPTGNIEFWPTDYSNPKSAALSPANASDTIYDFGDTRTLTGSYGSMQVHNPGAAQTLFAINHWGSDGNTISIGIGNNPNASATSVGQQADWTFADNAATYVRRVLHILVLPGTSPLIPAAVAQNVPEAASFVPLYSLNIPAIGNLASGAGFTAYSVDNSADVKGFSRVAYYMELQKTGDAAPTYVWASMDPFTNQASKLGVPNVASAAFFQQPVTNLTVFSNQPGIVNGTAIATGNIEFWPSNYTGANTATANWPSGVPNASGTLFDFGDAGASTAAGYGSMQVHNYDLDGAGPGTTGQTLFALNNWGAAGNTTNALCAGIGNNPAPTNNGVDWTFANNAATYDVKRILQVFVVPASDLTPPTISSIRPSPRLDRLVVAFSETLADTAAAVANFSIPGLTVTSAQLLAGQKEIALTTSPQTSGTLYTVNVTGVRDRSASGNPIAAGASATFTAYTTPAIISGIPETANYQLAYQIALPAAVPRWNFNPVTYGVDESRFGEVLIDRVAYLLELNGNWAYASFDSHTPLLSKAGSPTPGVTTKPFQQNVNNMTVASNVAGIVTGSSIATGNIEFWNGNYTVARSAVSPANASNTVFDFGDTMTAGGHGCLQVHNYGDSQTILAYSNWGANTTGNSEMGLGNNPNTAQAQDWTSTGNAATYATRNLYVLVRPGGTPTGNAPVIIAHPTSRAVAPGAGTTLSVLVNGAGPFTYQWRRNGADLIGQTGQWLDLIGFDLAQVGGYDVIVTGPNLVPATSRTAALTLTTGGHNPTFNGFSFTTQKDTGAIVSRASLAAKGADLDNDTLTVSAVSAASAQGGSAVLGATSVTYTPPGGYVGADSFTVTISDGQGGSVLGTVNVTILPLSTIFAGPSVLAFRGDGKLDAIFTGTPGKTYEIQRNTNLANFAGWTTIATVIAGDDGFIPATDANPPADRAFYRTRTTVP